MAGDALPRPDFTAFAEKFSITATCLDVECAEKFGWQRERAFDQAIDLLRQAERHARLLAQIQAWATSETAFSDRALGMRDGYTTAKVHVRAMLGEGQ